MTTPIIPDSIYSILTNTDNRLSSNERTLEYLLDKLGGVGLILGMPQDYVPPRLSDTIFPDIYGFGPEPGHESSTQNPGGSSHVGRVGGIHIDPLSGRLNTQQIRSLSIGDNAQIRFGRPPGWGFGYLIGGEGVVRRRPVGDSVWIGAFASAGSNIVYIFPAKGLPNFYDDSVPNLDFKIGNNLNCTYTTKGSRNAVLSGNHVIGNTELIVAEKGGNVLPNAGPFRIRTLQGTYDGKTIVLDAQINGVHKAGATTLSVKNVTQQEFNDIPKPIGAINVERVVAGRLRYKYINITYDPSTEIATFTLDTSTKLDKNVIDGAPVTMYKLHNIKTDFVHFSEGDRVPGQTTLTLSLVHPFSGERPDQELIDKIPTNGGWVRFETLDKNPPGPGKYDIPIKRLQYSSFDGKTLHLSEPLQWNVPEHSLINIEGCEGLLRDRNSGTELTMHTLEGVQGLTQDVQKGEVAEFIPRYGNPQGPGGAGHLALDQWQGTSGFKGYTINLGWSFATQGMGPNNDPGGELNHSLSVPVSGLRLVKFNESAQGIAVVGAGVRGRGDVKHNFHAGDYYTRVKPPNIEIDPNLEEEDPDDPSEPDNGEIATATINVATVIGLKTSGRLKGNFHNTVTGKDGEKILDYTGTSEGPPNPILTGCTYNQSTQNAVSTLTIDHLLPISTVTVTSGNLFDDPSVQHMGKGRVEDSVGNVIATFTYTDRTGNVFSGVTWITGSGTLPAGSIVRENYVISDFFIGSGTELSYANDFRSAAIGSATNVVAGTDRDKQTEIGNIGPNKEQGIEMGLIAVYERSDGKVGLGTSDILATEAFVDLATQGIDWKSQGAKAATTANITLSGLQTIDGVSLNSNDRVLVKNQTNQTLNGIYNAKTTAWTRTTDADVGTELDGAIIAVEQGTQANTGWRQTASPVTLGTTNIIWAKIFDIGDLQAGAGLTKTGSTIDVGGGAGITANADDISVNAGNGLEIVSDAIRISTAAAGNGLIGGGGSALSVGDGNGIIVNADDIAVNVGSGLEISSDAIRISSIAAGDGLIGGAGSALAVNPGTGIEISSDAVRIAATAAGNGLTGGGGSALAVGAGNGIDVTADAIAVDPQDFNLAGTIASRPAAGTAGRTYMATDQGNLTYRDNGSSWIAASMGLVHKGADETINNASAIQDDNHLFFEVINGDEWFVEAFLRVQSNTTADIKFKWSLLAGGTAQWGTFGSSAVSPGNWNAVDTATSPGGVISLGNELSLGSIGSNHLITLAGRFTISGNGTLKLQWAQNTATVIDTIVRQGSFLRLSKIL